MTIPGRMFWKWVSLNIARSVIIGAVFGVAWTLTNLALSQDVERGSGEAVMNIMQVLSVLIDSTFVYALTSIVTIFGISAQNLSLFVFVVKSNAVRFLNMWFWLLVLNVLINIVITYYSILMEATAAPITLVALNLFIASVLGYRVGYKSYCVSAVYGRREYKQYQRYLQEFTPVAGRFKRVMSAFVPFYSYDKTNPGFYVLPMVFIIMGAILTAGVFSNLIGRADAFPMIYMVMHALFVSVLAAWCRVLDVAFGESGEYRLHPRVEPEWTLTAKNPRDYYAKQKAAEKAAKVA